LTSSSGPALVEVAGVEKRFGTTRALRGVDLSLRSGQCLGLVGRNGAGKSTLVSILSGLAEPDAGTVRFDGQPAPRVGDIEGWREWIAFLDVGAAPPWCGHTPDAFFERLPEERLCFGREGSPGTRLETSSAELRAALRVAESDLVAFKETLEGWVRRMAPAHADRLVPCLDAAFQFTAR